MKTNNITMILKNKEMRKCNHQVETFKHCTEVLEEFVFKQLELKRSQLNKEGKKKFDEAFETWEYWSDELLQFFETLG